MESNSDVTSVGKFFPDLEARIWDEVQTPKGQNTSNNS